jgi:hypothetical protein
MFITRKDKFVSSFPLSLANYTKLGAKKAQATEQNLGGKNAYARLTLDNYDSTKPWLQWQFLWGL